MNVVSADGPFVVDRLPAGCALEVGVRPEHVTLTGEGTEGVVTLVEQVGDGALVYVRAAGAEIVARVAGDRRPVAGDAVRVGAPRGRVHLFDAATGERVEQA